VVTSKDWQIVKDSGRTRVSAHRRIRGMGYRKRQHFTAVSGCFVRARYICGGVKSNLNAPQSLRAQAALANLNGARTENTAPADSVSAAEILCDAEHRGAI
jgi:hypothetical protein